MTVVLLLVLLTVAHSDSRGVEGRAGESVTLTCKYDAQKHGRLSACWSRGDISNSGCNNQIISTDGPMVSSRYQLLGRLDEGDVSMTILNLTETDAGRYGCRVEIPGWFNDEKHHFDLTFDAAPITTTITGQRGSDVTTWRGSDVTPTESTVMLDQEVNSLQMFVGNTVRLSFIIFISALLLTAAYSQSVEIKPETRD
ncbi:hepatitis A virus cellular receptor 1 homolog isoform X2 [Seriola dumerili]|uniref:hepatitis A virus cellular receptor 1 homolog isoform X2 n=1 Tax=Seriola dumerili TaxID=41447 RepID=UPI000BBEC4CB|nr:hepatitis A virus cellular receptor 1 homolog isoform X2 [Seriola dumerili]